MTDADRAELERLRDQEQMRLTFTPLAEKVVCRMWGVSWRADDGHWTELDLRRKAMDRSMSEQAKADKRNERLLGAAQEKIVTALVGAALVMLAMKLGVHL